jgi:hypothetical protein
MNDTNEKQPWVFEVREERFEELAERFAKMVGRAKKCKLPAPSFEVIWEADEKKVRQTKERDDEGKWITEEYWVRYVYVVVEGDRPHLEGWDFVATIEHDGEANLVKSVPGVGEIPVQYRNAQPVCEHCRTARRRQETFVIRRQDDPAVTMQVGRNCLADFFPGLSPEDVAKQLEWWTEASEILGSGCDEEGNAWGGRYISRIGIEALLLTTQAAIEACGWVSRTKARETEQKATADLVMLCYMPPSRLSRMDEETVASIRAKRDDEKHTPMVQAALEWVRAINPEVAEDYLYNLNVVCRGECVREDRLGLACSLLSAHRRFLEGERQRKEFEERTPSEYVGVVGERDLFEGCLVKYISEPYATDFGTSTRVMFLKGTDVLIWWSSNPDGFELDGVYDLVCTPKKHEEFTNRKGFTTKQTVVNRVVIVEEKDKVKFAKKRAKAAKAAAKAAGVAA